MREAYRWGGVDITMDDVFGVLQWSVKKHTNTMTSLRLYRGCSAHDETMHAVGGTIYMRIMCVSPSAFRKCPSGHRHAHMIQFLYLQRMWVRQVMENILVNITISPSSREPTSIPQLTHTPVSLQWSPSMEHLIITRRRMRFEGARGSMVEWNGLGESEEARAYVRV